MLLRFLAFLAILRDPAALPVRCGFVTPAINKGNQVIKKVKGKWVALAATGLVFTSAALAEAPTTIEGVADLSDSYLTKGTAAAVGAGLLSFGWVLLRLVRKYTGKA